MLTVSTLMQRKKTLSRLMDAHVTGEIKKGLTPEHLYSANFRHLNDEQALYFVETLLQGNYTASST